MPPYIQPVVFETRKCRLETIGDILAQTRLLRSSSHRQQRLRINTLGLAPIYWGCARFSHPHRRDRCDSSTNPQPLLLLL